MKNKTKNSKINETLKIIEIINGRNKIIENNNICILETIIFYENIILNNIIKPFLFNENIDKHHGIIEIIQERLSFMDKYKIVCKISKDLKIQNFKKFDNYIKLRNKIAHNFSAVISVNEYDKESEINYFGDILTWTEYKKRMTIWCELSYDMANFIMRVYEKTNLERKDSYFVYCKIIEDCVLVQHNLIYPEIKEDYISYYKSGINTDLLNYLILEKEIEKENKVNKT